MNRIFYFSGYRLQIFHWQNETCVASFVFNPGEEGTEKFITYLRATANTPVRLLVDLIEEDFKRETIPHVGSTDRQAIVSRIVNRQYRKSKDYVYFKVTGREKGGRKDDQILYSVLSNPEILDPWLKPLQQAKTSISGIWSLPLLTEHLHRYINSTADNILLVSQQVPSNLRQTFLKNGLFESSRSAVVNLDDATIGDFIASEVEQTIRFLSNQRQIGFDEKIEIHIINQPIDLPDIQSKCLNSSLREYIYHDQSAIEEKLGCDIQSTEYSNGIYSYVCASLKLPLGHYGNRNLFAAYYQQLISKSLLVASIFLFIFSTILSLSFISESIVLDNETITLNAQTSAINNDYDRLLGKIEHKLIKTQVMQSSVLLASKIRTDGSISPQNFMTDISKILTYSELSNTVLTRFSWRQSQAQELNSVIINDDKADIDYGNSEPVKHLATLGGYIRVSQSSLKNSVITMNEISNNLNNNKQMVSIYISRMPVDTRSSSSIESEPGNKQINSDNKDQSQGIFEINLLMSGGD